ncbi:MAG: hypothetical protein CTY20_14315 [Hyphomicrobium sp.]|nr:MAG: hypothetical protein CTY20_14315 [Hyphomicrobium sp.]
MIDDQLAARTGQLRRDATLEARVNKGTVFMPTMSDQRRKRIQAKQRKFKNILKRTAKAAKRDRNKAST